jgi:hypothetical protein
MLLRRPAFADWIEAAGKTIWVDRLNSYKHLEGETKIRYLKFIESDVPELHEMITSNDLLRIE